MTACAPIADSRQISAKASTEPVALRVRPRPREARLHNLQSRKPRLTVALSDRWAGDARASCVSDRLGEFGERGGDSQRAGRFGGEFVVAAAEVLHEREPGDDDLGGAVGA